jgi:hypothetical protein
VTERTTQTVVAFWVRRLHGRRFNTPEEMRDLVFRQLERSDTEFGSLFGVNGTEKNRAIANAIPVRRTYGGKWTAGEYQRPVREPWDVGLEVRGNSLWDRNVCAQAQDTGEYHFSKGDIRCARLVPRLVNDPRYSRESGRIQRLAGDIAENKWFERVIVSQFPDGSVDLVEGQHRVRAVYWYLGGKTVPCDIIVWD